MRIGYVGLAFTLICVALALRVEIPIQTRMNLLSVEGRRALASISLPAQGTFVKPGMPLRCGQARMNCGRVIGFIQSEGRQVIELEMVHSIQFKESLYVVVDRMTLMDLLFSSIPNPEAIL